MRVKRLQVHTSRSRYFLKTIGVLIIFPVGDTSKSQRENKTALDQAESKERFWKNISAEYEKEKKKAEAELDEAKTDMKQAYKNTKPSKYIPRDFGN